METRLPTIKGHVQDVDSARVTDSKKMPYNAFFQRDVPAEDTELTHTGPGTPMGELMRRYWQPVCLSQQLADMPMAIRILGEDLVVFRSGAGKVGVLQLHCSHRGTSLEYGLTTEEGIRCCYHGWLYGVDGTILETPGEPADSRLKYSFRHGAYPAIEKHGLVFAYFGEPSKIPEFPEYESINVPGNTVYPFSWKFPCNWLQIQENIADQVHTMIFHNGVGSRAMLEGKGNLTAETWTTQELVLPPAWFAEKYAIDYRKTQDGSGLITTVTRRVGDHVWVRNNYLVVPNYMEIAGLFEPASAQKYFGRVGLIRWHVPHDDRSTTIFGWRYFNDEVDPDKVGDPTKLGVEGCDFMEGQTGGRPEEIRRRYPGDWDVVVGQRPIAVHAKEHLGSTDVGVAMWRSVCREAVRDNFEGAGRAKVGSSPLNSYAQNTVFKLPTQSDEKREQELLKECGRKVVDVVVSGDECRPETRTEEIRRRLVTLEGGLQAKYGGG